ncbi:hypothetical protein [Actimicrobium antarcticum]|uniref:Uncharacterized protein n=1 Tax=Actimicrobium antarcticum TaxID=1051899 RepID=A0ABP7SJF8_9BURK
MPRIIRVAEADLIRWTCTGIDINDFTAMVSRPGLILYPASTVPLATEQRDWWQIPTIGIA